MRLNQTIVQRGPVWLRWFIVFVLLLGVVLRIWVWWQSRNLVIDEANVARNLFESNYRQLAQPLKYEQYAPPVFLWIEKLLSSVFGFSERSLWLYPLLCGIGATLLLYRIARILMPASAVWLPVGLFALGAPYIHFTIMLKQYMPDAFTGLLLILLALRTDLLQQSPKRFLTTWILAGSLAIWSSMPSVFILTGIGAYYGWIVLKEKKWSAGLHLLIVTVIWLAQFGYYYKTILAPQAGSDYLQHYHRDFFLYACPANKEEWAHNFYRLNEIISYAGGWTAIALGSNLLFLFSGIIVLARKEMKWFLLLLLPVVTVLIAAALHQFSLIERVIMFMYPLLLLLIGYGLAQWLQIRWMAVKVVLFIAGLLSIINHAHFSDYAHYRQQTFALTEGLTYLVQQKVPGSRLYVPGPSKASYVYYTTIHPQHRQYATIAGAHLLRWEDNFSDITRPVTDTCWFIFSEDFKETERNRRLGELAQHMKPFTSFEGHNVFVFGYVPK